MARDTPAPRDRREYTLNQRYVPVRALPYLLRQIPQQGELFPAPYKRRERANAFPSFGASPPILQMSESVEPHTTLACGTPLYKRILSATENIVYSPHTHPEKRDKILGMDSMNRAATVNTVVIAVHESILFQSMLFIQMP